MTPTNVAQTRPDHEDPLLRTRYYRLPLAHVAAAVKILLPTLRTYGRRWHSVSLTSDSANNRIEIKAVVPVVIFSDDFTVALKGANGETKVDVHSASRIGRGDFGENRRHIIQLLHALNEQLGINPSG